MGLFTSNLTPAKDGSMSGFTAALTFLVGGIIAATGNTADWTQFRGPGGQGVAEAKNLPAEWSDGANVAWKAEMPGFGASSPIVLNGRIYVTCYSGYGTNPEAPGKMEDLRLHVVCLNLKDGELVCNQELEPTLPESETVRDHGYAAATPATDGKRLYVFFGKSGVMAFDLDGKQLWRTSVGTRTHGWGCGTSPVLYEDLVIVNASVESGELVAINKNSGEIVWQKPGMEESWNTPHLVTTADGKQELVVSVKDKLLAFDPRTGDPLWNCDGIQDYVCPSVVSHEGIVYAIGGRRSMSMAVRSGGRGDVTETHQLWESQAGANVSSPVVLGDHLFWVSDRNQVAYCLNRHTGEVLYSERMDGQPYASVVAADGKLYVVTRYDGTFVLAATPEFKILAHNELQDDSTFNASPVVVDDKLLIRSDRYLYCIQQ
jgi:outer membrane protein assembly factor BamB